GGAGGGVSEVTTVGGPVADAPAGILMARRRMGGPERAARERALAYGTNWGLGMQSRNGGFGAFDADNEAHFLNRIPFADLEAMIDPPTEDLTGRLLELMGTAGFDLRFAPAPRAHPFLLPTQTPGRPRWGPRGAHLRHRHPA